MEQLSSGMNSGATNVTEKRKFGSDIGSQNVMEKLVQEWIAELKCNGTIELPNEFWSHKCHGKSKPGIEVGSPNVMDKSIQGWIVELKCHRKCKLKSEIGSPNVMENIVQECIVELKCHGTIELRNEFWSQKCHGTSEFVSDTGSSTTAQMHFKCSSNAFQIQLKLSLNAA